MHVQLVGGGGGFALVEQIIIQHYNVAYVAMGAVLDHFVEDSVI